MSAGARGDLVSGSSGYDQTHSEQLLLDRANEREMRRPSYFFWKLLLASLLVAVPLLTLHSWTLYRDLKSAEARSIRDLHEKAATAAQEIDSTVASAERLLTYVVSHEEIRDLKTEKCSPFLRGLEEVEPTHALVAIFDLKGNLVCKSLAGSEGLLKDEVSASEWFPVALEAEGFTLSRPPAIGPVSKRAVVGLTFPVRSIRGEKIGVAVVSLDILALEAEMVGSWRVGKGIMALLNEDFVFIVRSPDSLRWMGKYAPSIVKFSSLYGAQREVIGKGLNGDQSVFSAAGAKKYGLRIVASVPFDDVFGLAQAEIRKSVETAAGALAAAILLAYIGAKTLAAPVQSLARSARLLKSDEGMPEARANEALPGEFKELAVEMNSLYDDLRASEQNARTAQSQSGRLARFYEASWRTSQATIRFAHPPELLDSICKICVETGQASMAWVGLIDQGRLTPVSWGGEAKRYTDRLLKTLGQDFLFVGGAAEEGTVSGQRRIVNDYMSDPRTIEYREHLSPFGVRSSAVIPFTRSGAVVGALLLYAKETGFYDKQVEHLLEEMASDIGSALTNFDDSERHEQTRVDLQKSQQQLLAIVDSAMVPVITTDVHTAILVFNGAAAKVFGVAAQDVLGRRIEMLVPERFRLSMSKQFASFMAGQAGSPEFTRQREMVGLRGDGSEFPMVTSTSKIWDGQQTLLTIALRDMSGVREADEARVLAALAEASNEAKTNFLARMSHELRSPLNAVIGFTQLLQESAKEKMSERERHQLDLIFLAGAQLRALVDDVLDVTSIESGKLSLSLQNFDLVSLLDGVVRMSEPAARSAGVMLRAIFTAYDDIQLRSDPVRLSQVVLNLVSNAIKYNNVGGTVTVGVEARHGLVEICVSDDGMGMTAEQLSGLFEPFNRLGRETTNIAGSGIGMALVRQLVELMGGKITVESEPGTGTVVCVDMPRPKLDEQLADTSALRHTAATEALTEGAEGVVLYIEDNPVNVILVSHIFKQWPGVRVVVAEDGAAGLARAAELRPDLILLDMHLPDMDGLDVLKALKMDPATHSLRVVALSASALPVEVAAAKDAGAEDYWTKPIDIDGFRRGVGRLLTLQKQVH